jgi:hypothetical protein
MRKAGMGMSESPAPYIAAEIIVGIDPGKLTGVAVYDRRAKRFLSLDSLPFWKAVALVDDLRKRHIGLRVRLEDPNLIGGMYARHDVETGRRRREKMASDVGKNKRDAQLWRELFETWGVECERVKPVRAKRTAGYFRALTGWKGSTNEHKRDAGMLVWGR